MLLAALLTILCHYSSILYHYLTAIGVEAEVYINKKKEHGVKDEFFLEDRHEDCVIVVDSINDTMEQYEKIWAQGKQLIILDHHIPNATILENATSLNLVSSAIDYPNPHLKLNSTAILPLIFCFPPSCHNRIPGHLLPMNQYSYFDVYL